MAEENVGLYEVCVEVGNGMAGAPVLHLDLLVSAPNGTVTGHGNITQAVTPPGGNYPVVNLRGIIHHTGFGTDHLLVALTGEYLYNLPPPAIGTVQHPFAAALNVGKDWNGSGGFTFGGHWISNCKVKKVPCRNG